MKWKYISSALLMVALSATVVGCERKPGEGGDSQAAAARCSHQIKKDACPFCNPGLIESEGFCGEHGVAEALCAQCRPYLKAVFRAKGDWCQRHGVPDTQCVECHPELKDNIRPGEHGRQ